MKPKILPVFIFYLYPKPQIQFHGRKNFTNCSKIFYDTDFLTSKELSANETAYLINSLEI